MTPENVDKAYVLLQHLERVERSLEQVRGSLRISGCERLTFVGTLPGDSIKISDVLELLRHRDITKFDFEADLQRLVDDALDLRAAHVRGLIEDLGVDMPPRPVSIAPGASS